MAYAVRPFSAMARLMQEPTGDTEGSPSQPLKPVQDDNSLSPLELGHTWNVVNDFRGSASAPPEFRDAALQADALVEKILNAKQSQSALMTRRNSNSLLRPADAKAAKPETPKSSSEPKQPQRVRQFDKKADEFLNASAKPYLKGYGDREILVIPNFRPCGMDDEEIEKRVGLLIADWLIELNQRTKPTENKNKETIRSVEEQLAKRARISDPLGSQFLNQPARPTRPGYTDPSIFHVSELQTPGSLKSWVAQRDL